MGSALSYIRLLRIRDSLGYVVVLLIGAGSFLGLRGLDAGVLLLSAFIVGELLMGSIFMMNNRFDYIEDSAAGKPKVTRNPLVVAAVDARIVEILALLLGLIGLILTVARFGLTTCYLFIAAWMLGLLYSAPPFRFKSRPGLDVASHGFVVVLLFLLGYSLRDPLGIESLIYAVPFFLLSTIYELRNHLSDWPSDSSTGVRTLVTSIGPEPGKKILAASIALFWLSILTVGYYVSRLMPLLVLLALASYACFIRVMKTRHDLVFDLHLWAIGGIYSGIRLLELAGLI